MWSARVRVRFCISSSGTELLKGGWLPKALTLVDPPIVLSCLKGGPNYYQPLAQVPFWGSRNTGTKRSASDSPAGGISLQHAELRRMYRRAVEYLGPLSLQPVLVPKVHGPIWQGYDSWVPQLIAPLSATPLGSFVKSFH